MIFIRKIIQINQKDQARSSKKCVTLSVGSVHLYVPIKWSHLNQFNFVISIHPMTPFEPNESRHLNLSNDVISTYPMGSFATLVYASNSDSEKKTTHSRSLSLKFALQPIAVLIGRSSVWVAVLAVAVDTVAIVSEPLFRGRCFSVAVFFWVAVWHVHECRKWTHWIGWNDIVG